MDDVSELHADKIEAQEHTYTRTKTNANIDIDASTHASTRTLKQALKHARMLAHRTTRGIHKASFNSCMVHGTRHAQ